MEIIEKYCSATGITAADLLNGKRDKQSVLRRNAIIYAAWLQLKPTVSCQNPKSKVYEQLGEMFGGMKRHTVHEKIEQFETELSLYRGHKTILEEVLRILN